MQRDYGTVEEGMNMAIEMLDRMLDILEKTPASAEVESMLTDVKTIAEQVVDILDHHFLRATYEEPAYNEELDFHEGRYYGDRYVLDEDEP